MINVESIFPYTIVEESGLYGITDNQGNLVVPCVMDDVRNDKEEEIGLSTWDDFFCVIIVKDSKYGFFTRNGKFIEPAYDTYAIDPCSNDIHVRTEDGYGVLASPEYVFEKVHPQCSLLEEIEPGYFDEDTDDFFDEIENMSLKTWFDMGINEDVVSKIKERLHKLGYEFTQELWTSTYKENDNVNIKEFALDVLSRFDTSHFNVSITEKILDLKAQSKGEEIKFWEIAEENDEYGWILNWCKDMVKRGAVYFISLKSMANANIPLLNRKIGEFLKNNDNEGYYSIFHLIDRLLPRPEHGSFDIIPIQFPAGKRPSCKYTFFGNEVSGEIGEIYLYEHGMHAYYVSVNVYDSENPEELIEDNHILDISDIVLSELLASLQQVIDPAGENKELTVAIDRAIKAENEKSPLAQILTDCGIYVLSLSDFGRSPRFYDENIAEDVDYLCVSGDDVLLTLKSSTMRVNTVLLNERCGNYSWIVEEIKAAANTAYKKFKN
jgi:hypothetical protein